MHGVATNINPRGNPTAISYQIISFAGLGNVYARVTVIYGIPREPQAHFGTRFLEIIDDGKIIRRLANDFVHRDLRILDRTFYERR